MMQSFWAKIVGYPPIFSLEARIFNAICLISAAGLFTGIINSLLIGMPQLLMILTLVFVCIVLCYYYSRFKMKLNGSIIFYLIVTNVLNVVNYRYNSGINGPPLLIFILSYFITISIVPQKQFWFWITLNITTVISLLIVEYKYPVMIINSHFNNKSRFMDFGFVYILMVFIIFLVTTTIRKSYYREKELVQQKANELEQSNETKNKLFSVLAHDLRAPLASIENYLEILSEFRLDENERVSIKKDLLKSTQYTQQMLSNLLSWSKSQMAGASVDLVALNLKEILQNTFQVHQTIAVEKGIQLINQLHDDVFIIADADMLQLIARNLINNAIKFTNPGGEIIVSDNVIGDHCHITIMDNGIGIPLEKQDSIFSLKATSAFGTKNEKGVGLGLVLCKEFTELQNGKISFESAPGVGTAFFISFKLSGMNGENNVKLSEGLKKK